MQRIDSLDGWRAICVVLVIASHLIGISGMRVYFSEEFRSVALNYGQIGVEFFFSISGFVICGGLLREARVNLAGFYIRRFFRIVPPLCLYVAAVAVVAGAGFVKADSRSFGHALSFTCNVTTCDWPLTHTWSLAYEEQFYLAFPILFIVAGSRRKPAVLGVAALMAAALLLLYWVRAPYGITPLRHFYSITCGIAAAIYQDRLSAFLKRAPWPSILFAALLPFMIQLAPWSSRLTWFGYLVCVGPAATVGLIGSAVHERFGVLRWRPLTAVGRASYGIYLWQQLATADYGTPSVALYATLSIGLGLVVWGLYRFVEAPLIDVGRDVARQFRRSDTGPVLA